MIYPVKVKRHSEWDDKSMGLALERYGKYVDPNPISENTGRKLGTTIGAIGGGALGGTLVNPVYGTIGGAALGGGVGYLMGKKHDGVSKTINSYINQLSAEDTQRYNAFVNTGKLPPNKVPVAKSNLDPESEININNNRAALLDYIEGDNDFNPAQKDHLKYMVNKTANKKLYLNPLLKERDKNLPRNILLAGLGGLTVAGGIGLAKAAKNRLKK